jgi:DNA-binding CsgD family transcriptional regulator
VSEHAQPDGRPLGERRRPSASEALALRLLDEIDYGMVLVSADARLRCCNHAAREALAGSQALQLSAGMLRPRDPVETPAFAEALTAATRGRRSLLTLGRTGTRLSISMVPIDNPEGPAAEPFALLVLGRREMCPPLSVRGYAKELLLTPAETRVLGMLCEGFQPGEIADRQGVALSTVRTQIGSIRFKTGCASIRELVRHMAQLPPLVGALRSPASYGGR